MNDDVFSSVIEFPMHRYLIIDALSINHGILSYLCLKFVILKISKYMI